MPEKRLISRGGLIAFIGVAFAMVIILGASLASLSNNKDSSNGTQPVTTNYNYIELMVINSCSSEIHVWVYADGKLVYNSYVPSGLLNRDIITLHDISYAKISTEFAVGYYSSEISSAGGSWGGSISNYELTLNYHADGTVTYSAS